MQRQKDKLRRAQGTIVPLALLGCRIRYYVCTAETKPEGPYVLSFLFRPFLHCNYSRYIQSDSLKSSPKNSRLVQNFYDSREQSKKPPDELKLLITVI